MGEEEFDALVAQDGLLEWAEYAGRRYGTPAAPVRRHREAGRDVVLEIDVQGARQVRARVPDAVLVLLAPASIEVLRARLLARGTEDEQQVERRLRIAREELAQRDLFDHVVVNDDVERAAAELDRIVDAAPRLPPPPH